MSRAVAIVLLLALVGSLLFLVFSVQAQGIPVVCKPHADITSKLKKQYGEVLIAMGLAGSSLFEVYASSKGTFTVLLTRPEMKGLSCIQGAGTDFVLTGNKYPKKGEAS